MPVITKILYLVVIGGQLAGSGGASRPALPIVVDVSALPATTPKGLADVYVSVRNIADEPVESIEVRVETPGARHPGTSLQVLAPHQSQVLMLPRQNFPDEFVLFLNYDFLGQANSFSRLVVMRHAQDGLRQSLLKLILPALLGIFGSLLGVASGAYFAQRAADQRAKFEWSKFIFERYESQYRQFAQRVAGSDDPDQTRLFFDQLENNAFVPSVVRSSFMTVLERLRTETRRDARARLRYQFLEEFEKLTVRAGG